RLRVQVPAAAVVELDEEQLQAYSTTASAADRFLFASELVEGAEALSPSAAAAADPDQLAGITLLDALVRNTDRKPEHILVRYSDVGQVETWESITATPSRSETRSQRLPQTTPCHIRSTWPLHTSTPTASASGRSGRQRSLAASTQRWST